MADLIKPAIKEYLTKNQCKQQISSLMRFRYCHVCDQIKPPRTHHCSCCNRCVQKMDHHCPWVGTCVGLRNHKLFILFLFYTSFGLIFTVCSMVPILPRIFDEAKRDDMTELGIFSLLDGAMIVIALLFSATFVCAVGSLLVRDFL